jgi:ABC-type multidrug transport system fused ATPase/permease subunit
LEKGQIIDQGTYDELLGKSDTFRKMAKVETHD